MYKGFGMKKKPTKIQCNLVVRGSEKANAAAKADLEIEDPEHNRALAIIEEALKEKNHEQNDQRTTF